MTTHPALAHPAFTRRALVGGAALAAPALLLGPARAAGPLGPDQPFTLGVASGDPWPDGVVIWTRLAPRPLDPDGGMGARSVAVRWEVAHDPAFARVARAGTARADAADGHSVHVEVSGLAPGRPYFYRFLAGGHASPVGRTRTAPARGAAVGHLRLAFASCQNYEVGRYAAWDGVVADDPDLVLFLGDYIYERAPDPKALRPHRNPEPVDLAGYRARYATYKLDPQLQAAHAALPWASTWDDHEVSNDYAGAWDERNDDPAWFLRRRAAAYQAYWEHMPLRRAAHPAGPAARLYRTLDWGTLAQVQLIDDRQYRGPRACQPGPGPDGRLPYLDLVRDCAQRHDPARQMLGAAQERWFLDALGRSRARWNLLAQQTLMAPFAEVDPRRPGDGAALHPVDRWDGFPAARDRIFRRWADARTPNPLVLSGDVHAFVAADIRHPDRPGGPPIAAEFVGGSLTSLTKHATWGQDVAANPGARYAEHLVRGYGLLDLDAAGATCRFRGLADARDPASPVADLRVFTVPAGAGGIA